MVKYTIIRESHGVALETVTARRADYAARVIRRMVDEALRGMGMAEAIGGNYGVHAHPDSAASKYRKKARIMAAVIETGACKMEPGDYRESTLEHHSRLKDGEAHRSRIFITRDA